MKMSLDNVLLPPACKGRIGAVRHGLQMYDICNLLHSKTVELLHIDEVQVYICCMLLVQQNQV